MKRILKILLFAILLIGITNTSTMFAAGISMNEYLNCLSKLEDAAIRYGGNKEKNILSFFDNTDDEFVDYAMSEYEDLFEIQSNKIMHTSTGDINIHQLLKGILNHTEEQDYIQYSNNVSSKKFLTAIDENNISLGNSISDSIASYYQTLTKKKRVKVFTNTYYSPKSYQREKFYNTVYKINNKKGITNPDIAKYLYENYPSYAIESISAEQEKTYVDLGSTVNLEVNISPFDAKYDTMNYSSNHPEIADVDASGNIIGKSIGEASVSISVNGVVEEQKIQVVKPIEALMDHTKVKEIEVGKEAKMDVSISPSDATVQELEYESSDPSIASIDRQGNIKTHAPGYVGITAKSYNGISITHQFKVYQRIKSIQTKESKTLIMGKPERLSYKIFPLGVTDQHVKFSSSDEDIVAVDENGMMYPKKNGKTQVMVYSEKAADIYGVTNIEVITKMEDILPDKNQSYYMNYPQKFKYDTNPSTTSNKNLKYTMKKNEYASIEKDGRIIPQKIGQTNLSVTSTDGTNLKKDVTIYIEQMVEKITVKKKVYMKKGESFQLYYTIAPVNATKKSITLQSENPKKIKIKGGSVIAKGYGKTKVTIQADDPGHQKAVCYIIVKRPFWHYALVAVLFVGAYFMVKRIRKKSYYK